ncbi:MAG: LPS assembly lipoprotein LptE [Thermoanaerobaculia bacterium]|nr:LPS assembly lipoprotein LptE [Thermoanaerobaculia bacterium]
MSPSQQTIPQLFSLPLLRRALIGALACLLAGCGYSLVGRGSSNLPEDVQAVFVEPLENETQRSQVEQILTQAMIDELVTRRRFEILNSADGADAILSGKVTDFTVRPVSFDSDGLANNFEILITADMKFERPPRGGDTEPETIWANSRYLFRQDYPLEEDSVEYFDRENLAIEETAEDFAQTLVTDIFEGF